MCHIEPIIQLQPQATAEIHSAALQYVRKSAASPAVKANEAAFSTAVDRVRLPSARF
jgi:hypothetical protein